MIKDFLKDSSIYMISTILTKGIGFIMMPIYTNFFAPADFGILDILLILGNFISIVVGLEVHQSVARLFPEATEFEEKRTIVSTAFWFILAGYSAVCVLGILFAGKICLLLGVDESFQNIIRLALVSYLLNFLYFYTSSQLRWQLKALENLVISVGYAAISAVLTYLLLKRTDGFLGSVFIAQIVAALVCFSASLFITRKYYKWGIESTVLKGLLSFSLPLVLSTGLVYGMTYIDRFVITYFLTTQELGLYGVAQRFASAVGLVTVGVQSAMTPLIYNHFRKETTPTHIARLAGMYSVGGILLVVILFFISEILISIVTTAEYLKAAPLIPFLALSLILNTSITFTPGIFVMKKTKYIVYINLFALILGAFFSVIFIKYYSLMGVAWASCLTNISYLLMYYFLGQKLYYIPFKKAFLRL